MRKFYVPAAASRSTAWLGDHSAEDEADAGAGAGDDSANEDELWDGPGILGSEKYADKLQRLQGEVKEVRAAERMLGGAQRSAHAFALAIACGGLVPPDR